MPVEGFDCFVLALNSCLKQGLELSTETSQTDLHLLTPASRPLCPGAHMCSTRDPGPRIVPRSKQALVMQLGHGERAQERGFVLQGVRNGAIASR